MLYINTICGTATYKRNKAGQEMVFQPSLQVCLDFISLKQNFHIISINSRLHYSFKPQLHVGKALPSAEAFWSRAQCREMQHNASHSTSFADHRCTLSDLACLLAQTVSSLHSFEVVFSKRFMAEDSFLHHNPFLFLGKYSAVDLLPLTGTTVSVRE